MYIVLFLVYFCLLFSVACIAVGLKFQRAVSRSPLSGVMGCGCCIGLLFAVHLVYPIVRGETACNAVARQSENVVIEYTANAMYRSSQPTFVILVNPEQFTPSKSQAQHNDDEDAANPKVVQVTSEKMQQVLKLLKKRGFFRMDKVLYPFGTIDGTWKTLSVRSRGRCHQVASYSDTAEDQAFTRLVVRLEECTASRSP